jgi:glutamyl-tRNA synthetase
MMSDNQIRVRFAPSPTGHLHVGGARTALFNWLYARKTGGVFVLRIEDTDAERSTEASYASIIEAMKWLGMDWDEGPEKGGPYGPYLQSARQLLYHNEAQKLLDNAAAYRCFCTPEELQEMREDATARGDAPKYDGRCRNLPHDEVEARLERGVPHVVRFKLPEGRTRVFDVIRGQIDFDNSDLDDFVLIKSDGRPTYNFAAAIDDAKMRITHIIRGDDHISNTPRQILIYKALDFKLPKFAHLPMILGADRSRLSKRHGAASVQEFMTQGYLPDAMLNYLALLGWSLDGTTEVFSREALIKNFSLKRVSKNPAAFDVDKLNYIDGEHFKRLEQLKRVALVFKRLEENNVIPPDFEVDEWLPANIKNGGKDAVMNAEETKDLSYRDQLPRLAIILKTMGNRLKNVKDAPDTLAYFYKDDYGVDEDAIEKHIASSETAAHLRQLADALASIDPFDRGHIETVVREQAEAMGVSAGDLIHPTRVALTGKSVSPDIFSVIHLLGRKKCVERMQAAASRYSGAK